MEWDFGGTIINSPSSKPLCSNFGESFTLSLIMNHDPSLPLSLSLSLSKVSIIYYLFKDMEKGGTLCFSLTPRSSAMCTIFLLTWKGAQGSLSPSSHEVYGVLLTHEYMTMKTRYDIHLKLLCWFFLTWASLDSNVSIIGSSIFKLHVTYSVTPDMFNKRNTWKKLFPLTLSSWREVYLWGQKWLLAPNNWWKL